MFSKMRYKGSSISSAPSMPAQLSVVYLWLVPVWGRSGLNNAVCPQSKQEQVVVYGSTSDYASLWLLITLRLLGVLRLFGMHKECEHQQNTRT